MIKLSEKKYKIKKVEEVEVIRPTKNSAKSTFKKTQISTVSTKSNFKKQKTKVKYQKAKQISKKANSDLRLAPFSFGEGLGVRKNSL